MWKRASTSNQMLNEEFLKKLDEIFLKVDHTFNKIYGKRNRA